MFYLLFKCNLKNNTLQIFLKRRPMKMQLISAITLFFLTPVLAGSCENPV